MDPPKGPIKGADGHPVALEMETSEAVTFSADLSEELLKLRKRISEHIEVTPMRRALTALGDGSDFSYCDPLLASHLVRILRKMEDREKLIVVNEMVKIVHDSGEIADAEGEPYYIRVEYEQVVDSMLNHAFEEGVLTINQHIEGLVMTTDFFR
ncbi:unnamed protein product [Caenorhabditis auriculariae]|uniref:Uncharacterized protein n=1 Tax=Caenorhabditis auriculariae TaxID=2777116 RepID=A0A8S1GPB2_9PELO|nr:unnamed protein product [Caenorhabditis auriculariae]